MLCVAAIGLTKSGLKKGCDLRQSLQWLVKAHLDSAYKRFFGVSWIIETKRPQGGPYAIRDGVV